MTPLPLFERCYRAALAAVNGHAAVAAYLQTHPLPPVRVVALGKAAQSMMSGAAAVLGENLRAGLVITGREYWDEALSLPEQVVRVWGNHPVPGEDSLAAGSALIEFVAQPSDIPLLFLLSGGTSSLAEVLVAGADLALLADLNRYLLGAGLDIATMNAVRQHVSQIKNGRLRQHLAAPSFAALYISDVPGDDLRVIGSGPLLGEGVSRLDDVPLDAVWKQRLQRLSVSAVSPWRGAEQHVLVASLGTAIAAVKKQAQALGVDVHVHEEFIQGEVGALAKRLANTAQQLSQGLHVWGGEPQVILPANPGRGGRNQQLVLSTARELAGREQVWLFCAATDGRDGHSETAAAWCSGDTWAEALRRGLRPEEALAGANAEACLQPLGCTLPAVASATNVMDLILFYKGNLNIAL
ncbi:MAG: DUF4147 domain-containing protein [Gammaproteobacteria bacterium]|nr:DUF4147 domain-containing protein [Gammaproteobacteria bacterium]